MSRSCEALGLLIKHVQHRNMRLLETALAPLGVSIVQWNALRALDRYPGVSMACLARLTFNSDQAFGTLATRLLRQGLIERRAGPGRATIHGLTPKGERLLATGRPLVQRVLAKNFQPLKEKDRTTLTRLLSKLLDDDYPRDP